ncbi:MULTISPECIES: type IV pilus assembly protein PilM [unclassified Fusibacter]|uniref:type IV pilus assembly protein PilM n=1 Tax=unclassified Fusibacter TaxID=2624464 RepID=UPI001011BEE6|nr:MULTISPECIES: type IV pilus assembly protein PilM [unclassified Fusibacter]MCK8058897.1 type IV pilus assembly protein PilM [Fusibacter sp. A2]NPE21971.1 type IV pilus assembly protein PilM [Fusibacter sp. A1]RXV61539.1 type IV pilus assembly protein PilM [Fusibacter sp. A1]
MSKKSKKPQTYLAIDIGGHTIKYAVGIFANGKLKVQGAYSEKLPPDVYENGMIKNFEVLEQTLRNGIKHNKITEKKVVLTIESSEILKREMVVPKVDKSDFIDMITYEVGQYLPIDVNNYVLQYKILGEEIVNEKEMNTILLGAMPKDMAKQHFDLMKACGLDPIAMDVHTNALSKLVEVYEQSSSVKRFNTVAYVDFGYQRIDVNIFEKGVNRLTRIIKMGTYEVDQQNASQSDIELSEAEEQRMKFKDESLIAIKKAYDAFNNLKHAHSLGEISEEEVEFKSAYSYTIFNHLEYIHSCLEEVDKVFKFYLSRSVENEINQVLVYGGTALCKDFDKIVQEKLDMPCGLFDPTKQDFITLKTVNESPLNYINVFGALIRN